MKILKNKLLGIVNTENELEFDENPFVRLIRINNTVYYFRGLYMKLWATGPVHYRTLKISKSYSFSWGKGVIRNSDGQETIQTMNLISDGKRDSDGYLAFTPSSDAWGIPMDTVVFRAKEGSTPDKIWLKAPTGTTEVDCYQVNTDMSDDEYTYYTILKLNTPGSGYVDFTDTVGPCEGRKIYCHDEYFVFDESSYSAITKIEFSKEVTEIPLGAFSNLYNMTEISLPQKLTQIGRTSFWYCQSLSSITIPENVTFIDAETFNRCDNLTDIYFDNYLVNLPANSPWGAPNAIVRCRDGYSSSDSGTNVTSMEITITSPNGVDTYPTTVMTFGAEGTNHTAVRFAPYDYYDARTSTQYYAFIWETCYNHMLTLSGGTVDAYEAEFISTLLGLSAQDVIDDYFRTSEHSMNILYVTRVETGSTLPELHLRSVSLSTDAETGDFIVQWGAIEYDRSANGQITIQNYPSGFVVAGSGNGDEEELLSNAISHKNWFVRGSSNGTSEYSVQSMILSGYNESVYDCVRFEPYDFDKNGVHYYAFIDSNCYNGIGKVVDYSFDATDFEMVKIIIGVIETTTQVEEGSGDTPGSSYDSLVTSENSMGIIYLTSIETSPSNNMSCYAYKRDLYIGTDDETGDAYVMIRPLSEGTSATVNWMTKSYSFTLEEDTDGE